MVESFQMMLQYVCIGVLGCMALAMLALFSYWHLRRFLACFMGKGRLGSILAMASVKATVTVGTIKVSLKAADKGKGSVAATIE